MRTPLTLAALLTAALLAACDGGTQDAPKPPSLAPESADGTPAAKQPAAGSLEAIVIGQRFGIAPEVLTSVLNASTGRNNSTENKLNQFILNKTYSAGFSLGLMAKDIGLAMEVAEALDVPAEFGHACLKLWKGAETSLGGKADHTEIIKVLGDLP